MKLGILTFHRTINEGSLLQAYCLQNLIQSYFPDSQVEIIDYQRLDALIRELKKIILKKPPFVNSHQFGKYIALNFFRVRHLYLSKRKCLTNDFLRAKEFIRTQNYDVIFVGSDTVWRIQNIDADLPEKNVYFLEGINNCRKISFAASMDKSRPEILKQPNTKAMVSKSLSKYQYISIRDTYSRQYLIDAGFPEIKINELPDPTLLWDFQPIVTDEPKFKSASKMIGLSLSSSKVKKMLSDHFVNQGFKVLNMLGPSIPGQQTIPIRFTYQQRLGIYREIDFLISDRFHGSIFALRIGKIPVIFLEDSHKYPNSTKSKGYDLFHRLNIPWAVYRFVADKFGLNDINEITAILNRWSELKPDVSAEIDRLQAEAKPKIHLLLDALR